MGGVRSSENLICHDLLISMGHLPFPEQKQRSRLRGETREGMGGGTERKGGKGNCSRHVK